jgi:S-formylglutathione hydrolase FrmB
MQNTLIPALLGLTLLTTQGFADDAPAKIDGPVDDAQRGVKVFTVQSPYAEGANVVEVLLPDQIEPGKTYRTLYILPVERGVGGEYGDAIAEFRKAEAHNRYGLICVFIAFGKSAGWCGTHVSDPGIRHEQYIKEVVVPLIESRFPTSGKPEDRLLIGFSKSGWGVVSLLLRNRDFFGAACSWDAPLMMTEAKLGYGSKNHYGSPDHAAAFVPITLARQHAAELAGGAPRLTIVGSHNFGPHTREFHELLESLSVPHRYDNSLRHRHHWESGWVADALGVFLGGSEK